MGGIFGLACKFSPSLDVISTGLKRLLYRGHDGVGIVGIVDSELVVKKYPIRSDKALEELRFFNISSKIILGHTRFATHGRPSLENTHPLLDCKGKIAVVGDGIIANYEELKDLLIQKGHSFSSRSDFEVIPHLIEEELDKGNDFLQAFLNTLRKLKGIYAIATLWVKENKIYGASMGEPLFIGKGEKCLFLSSDIPSLYGFSKEAVIINQGQAFVLTPQEYMVIDVKKGNIVKELTIKRVKYPAEVIDKAGFPHYMIKEIYEVPEAMLRAVAVVQEKYLNLVAMILHSARDIYVIANGTSLHAGMIAGYYFRDLAKLNAHVISAAEFPFYGLENVSIGTAILAISQSGETGDVLRAIREAKMRGGVVIGVTNIMGSRLTLDSNVYLPIGAGVEMAVPATKTFVSTLIVLGMLAHRIGVLRGIIDKSDERNFVEQVKALSFTLKKELGRIEKMIKGNVEIFKGWDRCYVSSRGINFPVALEGALKIKETAGLQAEGVETGELRHGPITLVSNGYPVIMIAPYEKEAKISSWKVASSVIEYGGKVISISPPDVNVVGYHVEIPETTKFLSPIASVLPLQLLAYKLGVARGMPIDHPRALAKAVTA
ncbi:MAG: glutamine--fructose-6-phosphate transaminase (isomerizing) [Thermoprotei archaeon]|nr:MAG: glutamine--fructose-6-phosphate transaminase (isomerizing) [Thermoprotei archaeon]